MRDDILTRVKRLLPLYGLMAFVVVLIVTFSVVISIIRLKETTFRLIEQSGETIIEIAVQAGENSLEASYTVDNLIAGRLIAIADLVGRLPDLNESILRDLVALNDLYGIDILDRKGDLMMTSRRTHSLPFPKDSITTLLKGETALRVFSLDIGSRNLYVLALPGENYPFVVVYFDPSYLDMVKSNISIGRIIQRLGNNPGIVYIVFQDTAGIIAATENVRYMTSIKSDTFLLSALNDTAHSHSRLLDFEGERVLELVRPIYINGGFVGLFRLGISLKDYRSVTAAGQRQLIAFASVIALAILLLLGIWLFSRGYSILQLAYEELELSVEKLIEKLPVGTLLLAPDMTVRTFNQLFASYFPDREIRRGMLYTEIFPDDMLGIARAKSELKPVSFDSITATDERGRQRVFSIRSAPVMTGDRVFGYIAIVEDITERVEAERDRQRMRELDLIAELAATLAHDIRNPLNSIMLISQRLMRNADEKISQSARKIRESVERIEQQMREFLQVAAPLKLHRARTSIPGLLNDIIDEWRERFISQNIEVETDFQEIQCDVDRLRFRRALENLIDNAIKAMPEGGKLTLRVYSRDGQAVIEVTDTGSGIPDDVKEQIFRPYFTTRPDGTGLGLAQVERTIRAHHGRIEVESRPGSGSTFRIFVPCRGEQQPHR